LNGGRSQKGLEIALIFRGGFTYYEEGLKEKRNYRIVLYIFIQNLEIENEKAIQSFSTVDELELQITGIDATAGDWATWGDADGIPASKLMKGLP
jgi:hypothetical protein